MTNKPNPKKSIRRDIRFRVYITFTLMVMFALAIVLRIFYIQFVDGDALREKGKKSRYTTDILTASRGNILTEEGQLLAASKPKFDIRIDFKSIKEDTFNTYISELGNSLATLYPEKPALQWENELKSAYKKGSQYYIFKNNVPYYEYQKLRTFPIFEKGPRKGGFISEPKTTRENPYGILAYRTIGLARENNPNIGLELAFDSILAGKQGSRMLRKTAANFWIPIKGSEIEPINGKDIITTIDIGVQEVAEKALMETLLTNNCQWGTAIVIETQTGKIKAMANLGKQKDGSYWEDYNYALQLSEPGSTFKLMSLFAILEDGYANINDNVNCNGGIKYFGPQRVRDDHLGTGTVPIKMAFAKSSNVAFASLIAKHYYQDPMKYIKHLQDLQLDKKIGIELVGEQRPTIKTTKSKSWNNVTSLPWIAYGYESLITPLHTAMVYNAVANNGKMMKPYLISEVREFGVTVRKIEPTVLVEKIGKQSTIDQLKEVMKEVVVSGTGKRLKSSFYQAAGKTGTAQVAGKGFTYADGVKQGSFVGFFPFENPKYTIAVMVRSTPGGGYYGGTVAAPVFKAIADKLYGSHIGGYNIPQDTTAAQSLWSLKNSLPDTYNKIFKAFGINAGGKNEYGVSFLSGVSGKMPQLGLNKINKASMPNVQGMGLRDAVYLLETLGMQVEVIGFGKVVNQSIEAGSKINHGQNVKLQLS